MKLLLDVGNTSIKWGVCEAQTIGESGSFVHHGNDVRMLAEQSWSGLPIPERVYVSNVAGEQMQQQLSGWAGKQWDITPVYIEATATACGVSNAYPEPGSLGVDRWAAMIGAHHSMPGTKCIVDCGTAITIDLLNAGGRHLGGMILPGVGMLQQLLLENTAMSSESRPPEVAGLLSTGTENAVISGVLYMAAATIDRVVADMAAVQGNRLQLVITGGDAGPIQTLLTCSARHDPELVLKGLVMLAGEN